MSRPAHTPLDVALEQHLRDLKRAEAEQREVVARHADAIAEVEAAKQARMDSYLAAKSCEQAIQRLGYCVMAPGGIGGIVGKGKSRLDDHPGDFRKPVPTTQDQP